VDAAGAVLDDDISYVESRGGAERS
jgi:hypothetical protein